MSQQHWPLSPGDIFRDCFRRLLSSTPTFLPRFQWRHSLILLVAVLLTLMATGTLHGAEGTAERPGSAEAETEIDPLSIEIERCQKLHDSGDYARSLRLTSIAVKADRYGQDWHALKARNELMLGRYRDAVESLETGLVRYPWSIRLKFLTTEVFPFVGRESEQDSTLAAIDRLAADSPWRYSSVTDLLVLGRSALLAGADPKNVLDGFYAQARKKGPAESAPRLAIGELALSRGDIPFAAEMYEAVLKSDPTNVSAHFGLAKVHQYGDRKRMSNELKETLARNANHIPALLFQAEQAMDADDTNASELHVERVLKINPDHPSAWALKSVLAHLANDSKAEDTARSRALAHWKTNPEVDFQIGQRLSRQYRFKEGAAAQRRALAFDPEFNPARVQLAQDLLRLGEEAEGWELAEAAHDADEYNVTTFNLLKLHDRIARFSTIEDESFIIRMDASEAELYGERVLKLLNQAKSTLCSKYDLELTDKVTVEIFPDENDFAVRTFGVPSVGGYLGVCFGKVITANSPGGQQQAAHPANWEAILWHEFAHVVTLNLTSNRMPRWLSEGISVYEERQQNSSWGQQMNSRYREMILGGELVPIAALSKAFSNPKSPGHVDFAYFQSSLVVELIIKQYGMPTLKKVLHDLKAGMPVNIALDRHTDGMPTLEAEFAKFAKHRARSLAPQADWTRHDLEPLLTDDGQDIAEFVSEHPRSVFALHAQAHLLMDGGKLEQAKTPLQRLRTLHPSDALEDNATLLLAEVHSRLSETKEERALLEEHVQRDANALGVNLRLIILQRRDRDFEAMRKSAERALAINPTIPAPWIALAYSSDQTGEKDSAKEAYQRLLALRSEDAPRWHFHLARLLRDEDPKAARAHVLKSLQRAPLNRDALGLLRELRTSRQ